MRALEELAPASLAVLPYKGDNLPISVHEVIHHNCRFLAYQSGGIPEQLPPGLHDRLLCGPDPRALVAAMAAAIMTPLSDHLDLIHQAGEASGKTLEQNARAYSSFMQSLRERRPPSAKARGAVSVVVPNYNGEEYMLRDMVLSLRNSHYRPDEVIFVDDGSDESRFACLQDAAARLDPIPTRILRHPDNRGACAARNTALALVATPYICIHDNDNIMSNRFLDAACRILDENPETAAVTCWIHLFDDGEPWITGHVSRPGRIGGPIGPDIGLGLRGNCFGDTLAVYRTDTVRELGGWDATVRSKWDDWQFFLCLTASGHGMQVLPLGMIHYRIRPSSYGQAGSDYLGWMRIGRGIPGLPKNQAYGLVRAANTPTSEAVAREAELRQAAAREAAARQYAESLLRHMQEMENRVVWRIAGVVNFFLDKRPGLKRLVRGMLKRCWQVAVFAAPSLRKADPLFRNGTDEGHGVRSKGK